MALVNLRGLLTSTTPNMFLLPGPVPAAGVMAEERPKGTGEQPKSKPLGRDRGPGEREGLLRAWRRRVAGLHQETYALYLACRDPRCPWYAWLLGALVVAYALSPLDLIPDFIPVLGWLDDLILVPLGILLLRRLVPAGLLEECRGRAAEAFVQGRPVSWVGGAVIVGIWLALAVLALYAARGWVGF